jgi:hypothetical protein
MNSEEPSNGERQILHWLNRTDTMFRECVESVTGGVATQEDVARLMERGLVREIERAGYPSVIQITVEGGEWLRARAEARRLAARLAVVNT